MRIFLTLLILGVIRSIGLGAGRAQSADPERANLSGWRWNRISPSRGGWQALHEVHEGRRWSNVHEYLCFHRIRVTLDLLVILCECALCPTIYPDAAHYVDVETYANPELNEWMLAQKLR